MQDDNRKSDPPFLKRWSQRKLEAAREASAPVRLQTEATSVDAAPVTAPTAPADRAGEHPSAQPPLPNVESLSFDSDFTPFLKPDVEESVRREALKKLVRDPRFNVMDGLDVYIDDYSKLDPIPPEILAQLQHVKYLFNPPKTRVNAHGHVEDVPEDEPIAADPAAASADEHVPPESARAPSEIEIVDNTTISVASTADATGLPSAPVDAVPRPDASK